MQIDASLKKLKKAQLLAKYLEVVERQSTTLAKLVAQKEELSKKCEYTLKLVADWENHKQILLQDTKHRFQVAQIELKTTIAEQCNFLRELAEGTNEESLKKLLESKIANLEKNHQLVLMTETHFDPTKHIAIGKQKNAEKIKKTITHGYIYKSKPILLAKVLLD